MAKKRADVLLVERGLVESRTKAQALIMAGKVFAGDHSEHKLSKAGTPLPEDTVLTVKGMDHPWVSRGGLKLVKALEVFDLSPHGVVAMDVGSSTGGFTDVLLHHGARKVYAVDVGTNQLAWKLRTDNRVVVMEQTNARHLTADMIDEAPNLIVCDASFIGLTKVLPAALALAAPQARLVALIKPQFEAGRDAVQKGGIVRDPAVHQQVCDHVRTWLDELPDWTANDIIESPITGADGNVEFLIFGLKS